MNLVILGMAKWPFDAGEEVNEVVDTLNLVKAYSQQSAAEMHHKMPSQVMTALMTANNQMLKAASFRRMVI